MATLRDVKNRIKSVNSTMRITKAMEMVAASKLRRAQQKVEQARPYSKMLTGLLSQLAAASTEDLSHPFLEARDIKKKTLVLITSDRGLCGSYNSHVIRKANKWLVENKEFEVELVTIGKKCNDFFKRREWPIANYYGDWNGNLDYDKVREIVRFLTNRFLSGETDQIELVFTRFISTVKYNIVTEPYLPIIKPEADQEEGSGYNVDYIFEPSPEAIFNELLPNYSTSKMINALAEAIASEHGSRMIAMGNATTNANEMSEMLTLDYNKARQGQITTELLEVVSGAEALKG